VSLLTVKKAASISLKVTRVTPSRSVPTIEITSPTPPAWS